jgi:8-oxo-dGTP diphosphatase
MAPNVQPVRPDIEFLPAHLSDQTAYTFAIIVARYRNSWIWVRHRDRTTWELPAGHLEPGETADQAAQRELFEETGAISFDLESVVSYQGTYEGAAVFGKIFLAEIHELGELPDFEIVEVHTFMDIPLNLTYPNLQPQFYQYVMNQIDESGFNALTQMQNIGITLAEHLHQAGIKNPEEFRSLGSEKAFLRIQAIMPDACLSQLYAMEGAIQGVRWHSLDHGRKEELRFFYNQLNPSSF